MPLHYGLFFLFVCVFVFYYSCWDNELFSSLCELWRLLSLLLSGGSLSVSGGLFTHGCSSAPSWKVKRNPQWISRYLFLSSLLSLPRSFPLSLYLLSLSAGLLFLCNFFLSSIFPCKFYPPCLLNFLPLSHSSGRTSDFLPCGLDTLWCQ